MSSTGVFRSHWSLHKLPLTEVFSKEHHAENFLLTKHIKKLFISHIKGGIPHQIYCKLKEGTRDLTTHISLWKFSKKPLQEQKILQSSFKSRTKNHAKIQFFKRIHGPQMILHSRYKIRSLSQHQITIHMHHRKIKKIYLFCSPFLHTFSL